MEITTKDGRAIPLKPVGRRFVAEIMGRHQIPGPPTYAVANAAGDIETYPHDEKSAKETPGAWQEWIAYQEARTRAFAERHGAATDFLIYSCVDLEPTPAGEWAVDLALFGLTTPDPADKVRYKAFWVENELLPDPDDQAALMAKLWAIGGIIDDDRVTEFERFFRSTLARIAIGGSAGPAASGPES